jgi:hypothetical protein
VSRALNKAIAAGGAERALVLGVLLALGDFSCDHAVKSCGESTSSSLC